MIFSYVIKQYERAVVFELGRITGVFELGRITGVFELGRITGQARGQG